jgi:hypothetical protein
MIFRISNPSSCAEFIFVMNSMNILNIVGLTVIGVSFIYPVSVAVSWYRIIFIYSTIRKIQREEELKRYV